MARKEQTLMVGQRYRGDFWRNEYGQAFFEADQRSGKSAPSNMKLIKKTDTFALYESKNLIEVRVTFSKSADKSQLIQSLKKGATAASEELKNYEFTV